MASITIRRRPRISIGMTLNTIDCSMRSSQREVRIVMIESARRISCRTTGKASCRLIQITTYASMLLRSLRARMTSDTRED